MTQSYTSQATTPGDFRVGHVISRSFALLFRHFLTFFIVTLIALPGALIIRQGADIAQINPTQALIKIWVIGFPLLMVMGMFSSAIILHGTLQDMRKRPVNLLASLDVAFRRLLPLVLLALLEIVLTMLGLVLLIVPGIMFYTMWLVSGAVCVVERTGPWRSMRRSQELTKGHRWKIFGLLLVLILPGLISHLLDLILNATVGATAAAIGHAIWSTAASAFSAVVIAVTYYDLRAAKEGIDIEQIASVFD
jgi:hypothetical protein